MGERVLHLINHAESIKEQIAENAVEWEETLKMVFEDFLTETIPAPFGIQILKQQNVDNE